MHPVNPFRPSAVDKESAAPLPASCTPPARSWQSAFAEMDSAVAVLYPCRARKSQRLQSSTWDTNLPSRENTPFPEVTAAVLPPPTLSRTAAAAPPCDRDKATCRVLFLPATASQLESFLP